jgi:AcrR family transcriptional regulator
MLTMSSEVSYEQTGRRHQKARTRAVLVDAARELIAVGASPTVEDAAARASISRATAYRYFPNQRALLAAARPELDPGTLLEPDAPEDPELRLESVVDGILRLTLEHEHTLRTMLRLSLDPSAEHDLPFRKGMRLVWVEQALEPLRGRLDDAELRRLVHAIAAAVGIDSLVWMTDVAGLGREEACELMRWSARALLTAAL